MIEILHIILRVVLSIIFLIVLARLTGAKQISQLTYFDYIVGITVGSIAGTISIDKDIKTLYGLIAITLFMLISFLISILTNKSIFIRRLVTGNPVVLIDRGEILYKGLRCARFDMNDLLRELRSQGYFDIEEINYAILEPSGTVSIMTKAYARPPKLVDLKIQTNDDPLLADVVIDGKIIKNNLASRDKTKDWLLNELKKQRVQKLNDVMLATLDDQGNLKAYLKNYKKNKHTSLM